MFGANQPGAREVPCRAARSQSSFLGPRETLAGVGRQWCVHCGCDSFIVLSKSFHVCIARDPIPNSHPGCRTCASCKAFIIFPNDLNIEVWNTDNRFFSCGSDSLNHSLTYPKMQWILPVPLTQRWRFDSRLDYIQRNRDRVAEATFAKTLWAHVRKWALSGFESASSPYWQGG